MVIMAGGIACRRVRTTTMTAVESRKMAVILQIIGWQGHEALVYHVLLWHWMHAMINWHLSKQGICWPVSRDYIAAQSTTHRGHVFFEVDCWPSAGFWIGSWAHVRFTFWKRDRIVRKPVNASPGLKFIRIITYKTQIKIPSWVSWIGHWTAWPRSYAFRLDEIYILSSISA